MVRFSFANALTGSGSIAALAAARVIPATLKACDYAGGPYDAGWSSLWIAVLFGWPLMLLILAGAFAVAGMIFPERLSRFRAGWLIVLTIGSALIGAWTWSSTMAGQPNCFP